MQNETNLTDCVINSLEEMKAHDVVTLDVHKLTDVTDKMIIASGTSNRHVKSISDFTVEQAKKLGRRPLGVEGADNSEWVLIDLDDLLVHVMLPRVRDFYNLEKLWSPDLMAHAAQSD
ncbi:MAG: ribosome silencing factor [Gammaproteobacteria bacterium]